MNLYFRLLRIMFAAYWFVRIQKQRIAFPDGMSRIWFRALPLDCDLNFHLNQARYSNLTDLGRLDWLVRSGLGAFISQRKCAPIVLNIHMEYRREIKPFERFSLETRIFGWTENMIGAEHLFFVKRTGEVILAAKGFAKIGLYDRKERRFILPEEYAEFLNVDLPQKTMSESEHHFLTSRILEK